MDARIPQRPPSMETNNEKIYELHAEKEKKRSGAGISAEIFRIIAPFAPLTPPSTDGRDNGARRRITGRGIKLVSARIFSPKLPLRSRDETHANSRRGNRARCKPATQIYGKKIARNGARINPTFSRSPVKSIEKAKSRKPELLGNPARVGYAVYDACARPRGYKPCCFSPRGGHCGIHHRVAMKIDPATSPFSVHHHSTKQRA